MRFLFILIAASVALTFLILSRNADAGEGVLDAVLEAENATGAILVRRLSDGVEWTGGGARIDQRLLPASTFKIVNSLIILESGVISDPDTDVLAWDGVERSRGWDGDQTLSTAFRRSAVWAYQHWARDVGHARMGEAVTRLGYGNADIGGPETVDLFWLEGPLEISAREQVEFLERLHARALPMDTVIQDTVIDVMRHRSGEGWTLYAKTGWAIRDEPNHGWYVGWLETEAETWLFAVNVDLDYETGDGALRERLARRALVQAGAPESLVAP